MLRFSICWGTRPLTVFPSSARVKMTLLPSCCGLMVCSAPEDGFTTVCGLCKRSMCELSTCLTAARVHCHQYMKQAHQQSSHTNHHTCCRAILDVGAKLANAVAWTAMLRHCASGSGIEHRMTARAAHDTLQFPPHRNCGRS